MRYILLFLLLFLPSVAQANLFNAYNSVCHIRGKKSLGSGGVFFINDKHIYVLTAAHILEPDENIVTLFFFHEGFASSPIGGMVFKRLKGVNREDDVAIITCLKSDLGNYSLPRALSIADRLPKAGEKIYSAGCPQGHWPNVFIGHVDTLDNYGFIITPKPLKGRSGSVVVSEQGEIYGIILLTNGFCNDFNRITSFINAP